MFTYEEKLHRATGVFVGIMLLAFLLNWSAFQQVIQDQKNLAGKHSVFWVLSKFLGY